MSKEKAYSLYKSWRQIVQLKEKMGATILELVTHPDATPEQIMEPAMRYRKLVNDLRENRQVIVDALHKHGHNMLASDVASTKL